MSRIIVKQVETLATLRSREPRELFTGKDLFRVEFGAGLQLYKLTGNDAVVMGRLASRSSGLATPWWFSHDPQTLSIEGRPSLSIVGIDSALTRSRRAASSLSDYARSRGAVNMAWGNPMDHLLVVKLLMPAAGLVGRCSPQLRSAAHSNVHFIGGDLQFYLPDLTPAQAQVVRIQALG